MLASLFDASVWAALVAAVVAAVASILFLRTRNFFYDSLALAATEIGLLLLAGGIVAGVAASRLAGRAVVDLGRAFHRRISLLAALRAVPDAAQCHRRAFAPRRLSRSGVHLCDLRCPPHRCRGLLVARTPRRDSAHRRGVDDSAGGPARHASHVDSSPPGAAPARGRCRTAHRTRDLVCGTGCSTGSTGPQVTNHNTVPTFLIEFLLRRAMRPCLRRCAWSRHQTCCRSTPPRADLRAPGDETR